jgi:hypothetical protein
LTALAVCFAAALNARAAAPTDDDDDDDDDDIQGVPRPGGH